MNRQLLLDGYPINNQIIEEIEIQPVYELPQPEVCIFDRGAFDTQEDWERRVADGLLSGRELEHAQLI